MEATYPSFIIVSWSVPTSTSETRVGWKYHVEWSQALTLEAAQFQEDISYTHIVLPVDFSTEFCVVRVTARGRILTSPDNVSDIVLASSVVVPGPYRYASAWSCMNGQPLSRAVFDACVLCGSPNFDLRALRPFLANVTVRDAEYVGNGLTKSASMTAVRVQYAEAQPPLASTVIYVMVDDAQRAASSGHSGNVTFLTLQQWASDAHSCVVVCGVGANGVLASKLTHLLLASIDANGQDKEHRHNAFCITYGSPRLEYFSISDGLVLSGTAKYSGNFLHYTTLPLSMIEQGFIRTRPAVDGTTPITSGGISSSPFGGGSQPSSPARSGGGGGGPSRSSALSAPLGIRCCISISPSSGKAVADLHCSSFARRSEEELGEAFNLSESLPIIYAAVNDVDVGKATEAFAPSVENCGCSISDGAFMDVVVTGQHLHLEPKIFISVGGSIVPVKVVSCAPTKIVGSTTILALPQSVALRGELDVEVSITTSFGSEMNRSCTCTVPSELAALATTQAGGRGGPDAWLRGPPVVMLQNSVVVEALLTSITSGQFHPCPSTRILAEVEHVADILHSAIPSNVNVSIFARVANAAARAVQSGPLPPIPLPKIAKREFLATTLAEFLRNDEPTSKLRLQFSPWITRIVTAMPWLEEAAYTARLKVLLQFLLGTDSNAVAERCGQAPLLLVESALHGLIFRLLRRLSQRSMKATDRLPAVLSFEAFYDAMIPVLQKRGVVPPSEILLDAAFLWTSSMMFQLRRDYLFSKLVVVTGSHGSGRTTVTNELKKLSKELADISVDRREMMILVRRSTRPLLIRDVLQLGLPMSLVVTGEVTDVESFDVVEMFRMLKNSAVCPSTQHLHPVVTKIDECLDDATSGDGATADGTTTTPMEWCKRARSVLERKCATISREFMTADGAVLLAVQPKPHFKGILDSSEAAAVCRELHGESQRVLGEFLVE